MKKLLERLLNINGGNILDCHLIATKLKYKYIIEEIFDNSDLTCDIDNYYSNVMEDILEVLFYEFSKNGFKTLETIGRGNGPFANNGDYVIFPWHDSDHKKNKYDPFGKIAMEYKDYIDKGIKSKNIIVDENGNCRDLEGDLINDRPNLNDYDVILLKHTF